MGSMKKYFFWVLLLVSSSVEAATITVSNNNDSGVNSLRAAITLAEMDSAADEIIFSGAVTSPILLFSTLPTITKPLSISGSVTISGGGAASGFRILNINIPSGSSRSTITLQSLTFSEGDAAGIPGEGGAIAVQGNVSLTITNCIFTGNLGTSGGALTIFNNAQVTVSESRFQENISTSNGGAIYLSDGTLQVKRSQFIRNRADSRGGAFSMSSASGNSTGILMTSLFLQNDAAQGGGAVNVFSDAGTATLDLQRLMIFGNDGNRGGGVTSGAGGIYTSNTGVTPTVRIRNSLLAINGKNRSGSAADSFTGGTDNCEGSITSSGQNLSDIMDGGCGLGSSDFSAATAGINYTATSTQLTLGAEVLLSTSQAIDQGSSTFCTSSPADLDTDINSKASYGTCDIGAYEFGSCGDSFIQTGAGETCDPVSSTCDSSCHVVIASGGTGGSSGSGGDSGSGGSSGSGGAGGSTSSSSGGCSLVR